MPAKTAPLNNEVLTILRENRKKMGELCKKMEENRKKIGELCKEMGENRKEMGEIRTLLEQLKAEQTVIAEDMKLKIEQAYTITGLKTKTKISRKKADKTVKTAKKTYPTTNYWFIAMFEQQDDSVQGLYGEDDVKAATDAYENDIKDKPASKNRNREKGIARLMWKHFDKEKKAVAKTAFTNWKNLQKQKENIDASTGHRTVLGLRIS